MTTVLYTTPNEEYCIEEYSYPYEERILKDEETISYYIFKKKKEKKSALESDWYLFREEMSIENCLKWLLQNKIISKDEYSYELDKLTPRQETGYSVKL